MKSALLEKYIEIIQDLTYVIKKRQYPIHKLKSEKNPAEILLTWNPIIPNHQIKKSKNIDLLSLPPKKASFEERNYICNLCEDRLSGIRNFSINGKYPILVLHYSGETNIQKEIFVKRQDDQIFRSLEEENLFERMIQKSFGFSHKDFFYQEFPACNFDHQVSNEKDWQERTKFCTKLVKETIQAKKIKGIIFLGQSGVLFFGKEKAKKLLTQVFKQFELPTILLRSPASLVTIEQKKLQLKENNTEFQKWKQQEISIKKQILNQLANYQKEISQFL